MHVVISTAYWSNSLSRVEPRQLTVTGSPDCPVCLEFLGDTLKLLERGSVEKGDAGQCCVRRLKFPSLTYFEIYVYSSSTLVLLYGENAPAQDQGTITVPLAPPTASQSLAR